LLAELLVLRRILLIFIVNEKAKYGERRQTTVMLKPINTHEFALVIGADTGLWLMPVQYKRIARPQATPKDNVEE